MSTARLEDRPPIQRFAVLATALLVMFGVIAAIAEGAVRIRHHLKHGDIWGIEDTYRRDPETGLRVPIAGLSLDRIQINSMGFRGPEIPEVKPTSTIRIAFLGASTTYCAEVSGNGMVWPHLVVDRLRERYPGQEFDYVNGGVPGYVAKNSLKHMKSRIGRLDPDVVIIYHGTNDLSMNTYRMASAQGLVPKERRRTKSWLSKISLLWMLAEKNARILLRRYRALGDAAKLDFDENEATEPFDSDLRDLIAESGGDGRIVGVATFSSRLRRDQSPEVQIQSAITALYYMPYLSIDGLIEGYEAYNRTIRRVATETNSLLIGGENEIPGDAIHFKDSVHFTDAGSRAMARRVSGALMRSETFRRLVESKQGPAG